MEIKPSELHQRVPFFTGSKNMVDKAEEFMMEYSKKKVLINEY
jgi:fructose-1,6-bisphosphatase I